MNNRIQIWVASLALLIGLGSIGASVYVGQQSNSEVCRVKIETSAKTRKFLTDLLSDPSVPPAQRASVTALALKDFPPNPCTP